MGAVPASGSWDEEGRGVSDPQQQGVGWGPADGETPPYGGPPSGPPTGVPPFPGPAGTTPPGYGPPPAAAPPGPPPAGWGPPPGYGAPAYGAPQYGTPQYGAPPGPPPPAGAPQYGAPPPGWRPPAAQPGIVPLRPLGLGEIYDGAFRAVRSNPAVMFGVSAVVVALAVVVQTTAQVLALDPILGALEDQDLDGAGLDVPSTISAFLAYTGTVVVSALAVSVLSGLLILSVSRSVIGQRLALGEFWALARGRVWRLLALTLLLFSIPVAAFAVWGGLIALGVAGDAWGLVAVVAVVGGVGLVVFSVWFATRTLLSTPSLVLEHLSVLGGFARGWRLSRGSFWRLLGIYLLTQIVVGIAVQIIATPFALFSGLVTGFGGQTALSLLLLGLSQLIAQCLTVPFVAGVTALLYVDTRIRREGLDVELARAAEAVASSGPR